MSIKSELKKKIKLQKQSENTERELILSRLAQFLENNKQELAEYSKLFILNCFEEDPGLCDDLFFADGSFNNVALLADINRLSIDLKSHVEDLSIEELRIICTEEEYWKLWKSQFLYLKRYSDGTWRD
jgi:hypothetical protein